MTIFYPLVITFFCLISLTTYGGDFDETVKKIIADIRADPTVPEVLEFANKMEKKWDELVKIEQEKINRFYQVSYEARVAAQDARRKTAWSQVRKLDADVASEENPDEAWSKLWKSRLEEHNSACDFESQKAARDVFQKQMPDLSTEDLDGILDALLCDACQRSFIACKRHGKKAQYEIKPF